MGDDEALVKGFGATVRRLRSEQGYSQEGFAFRVGLHRTYVGNIERGEKAVTIVTANKVARARSGSRWRGCSRSWSEARRAPVVRGEGAAGGRPLECAARCGTGYRPPPTVAKVSCVCGFWYGSLRALYSCTPAAFGSSPCRNVGLPSSSTSRPPWVSSL